MRVVSWSVKRDVSDADIVGRADAEHAAWMKGDESGLLARLGQDETGFHDGGGVHLGDVDEQLLLRLSGEAGPRLRDGWAFSSAVESGPLAGPEGQASGAARGVPTSGGLNHDAEHALGLVLRQPERRDGVLDRESVGDQSAGEFRAGSQ
jgi:hypothetical protein